MELTTKNFNAIKEENPEFLGYYEKDDCVFHVFKAGNYLAMGTGCNIGILWDYEIEIDPDFSLDENLQNFIELVEEAENKRKEEEENENNIK